MEQLSSCYFCGAALDAQIEPYQVIPPQFEPTPDQQRAVSLCPTCRQKLAHVVETVVGATDAEAASAIDDVTTVEPDDDLLRNEAGDERDGGSDEASGHAGVEPIEPDGETGTTGAEPADAADRSDDSQARPDADPAQSSDPLSTDEPDERTAEANGERATVGNGVESRTEHRTEASDDRTRQSQTTGDTTDQHSGGDDTADDGPSLTALEYNKVMRLLQSREFPVERAEIHEIATSAYQVSDREFDAIIDAAIERGLIDEENGQLVSGD